MKPISFLIIYTLSLLSCGKDKPYEFVEMKFELPATMTPIRDTINLGDTLLFTMNFSDTLKDAASGNSYKIKNFSFNFFLNASKLVDSTKAFNFQQLSTDKFIYFNVIGNFVNTGTVGTQFKLQYASNTYKAICKIKPTERGIFAFHIVYVKPSDTGIPDSILTLPSTPNGKKQIPFLIFPVFIFNNGINNFHLLQRNVSDIAINKSFEYRGYYTFVVR